MRFPAADKLLLPCRFERFVPGRPHADGRRYLPLIVLRIVADPQAPLVGVVDRHHRVDPALEGSAGVARLVFLLSAVRLQQPPYRRGLLAEVGLEPGRASTAPLAYGRATAVPTWEVAERHLPYETLYTELLLDIGSGIVGVRTNATADDLAAHIGKPRIEAGDWLEVRRSRIDILSFERSPA